MSAARVLVLNSCVSGAGRSLLILLDRRDKRVELSAVIPEEGVIASRLSAAQEISHVPEFVERIWRSPYQWPDRLHMPWAHPIASMWSLSVAARRIEAIAEGVRPDVIYCNQMLAKPLGVRIGNSLGLPVVFHSRATHHLTVDDLFYSWLGARKCVKRIICNSEAAARVYRRSSGRKTIVVPNGIDTDFSSRRVVEATLRRSHEIPGGPS